MNRPDFSNYLVHFSSNGTLKGNDHDNPVADVVPMTAQERLISILRDKKIRASSMPWTGAHAVCFTECPWSSLLAHTKVYSPYGVGFSKKNYFCKAWWTSNLYPSGYIQKTRKIWICYAFKIIFNTLCSCISAATYETSDI